MVSNDQLECEKELGFVYGREERVLSVAKPERGDGEEQN